MLKARIILGFLIIVVVLGLFCLDKAIEGRLHAPWAPLFFACVAITAVAGVHETCEFWRRRGWRVHEPLCQLAVLGMLTAAAYGQATGQPLVWHAGPLAMDGAGVVFVSFFMLLLVAEVVRTWFQTDMSRAVEAIAGSTLAVLYIGVLVLFVVAIRLLREPDGLWCLLTYLAVVKCSDIGGFAAGRLLGRHKLNVALSPGKTIEGCIGGLALSTAAALGFGYYAFHWPWWQLVVFGLAMGVVAMLGDLVESLFKRASQVKDSGKLVPGFGGVLDIIDSILLTAPVGYGLMRLFGAQH